MSEMRLAPLSGVLFGLLLLGSFLITGNAEFMPPAQEAVMFYQTGPRRVMVGAYLMLLACGALVWFTASIFRSLQDREDDRGRLSVVAASGGGLAAAMLLLGATAAFAAAERTWIVGAIDPSAAATMFDFSGIAFGTAAPIGFGLLIGSTGLVVLRSGTVPRWVGWFSLLTALGLFSPFAWALVAITLVWVPAAGVWIYRTESTHHLVPSA